MGLFSRNEPAAGSVSRSRSSMSSEAQAAELRGRARRRLIGALALVLAAVIVVPALFDDLVTPEMQAEPLIVVPMPVPGTPNLDTAGVVASITPDSHTPDNNLTEPSPIVVDNATVDVDESLPPNSIATVVDTQPEPKVDAKPAQTEIKPVPKPVTERTDDGSVAIALLEGRSPGKQAAKPIVQQGSFTLQIAAYTTDHDAQSRREKLINAGVTNAYVENAIVNDKSTYRLRVGPFPSRDAAQAAQARLRALGYDNSFISAK